MSTARCWFRYSTWSSLSAAGDGHYRTDCSSAHVSDKTHFLGGLENISVLACAMSDLSDAR